MSFPGRGGTWAILVSYHGSQNRTLWEGMSPFSKLVSESGGNVQIGSLPNMERFHLGTVGSSTAGSLEAQLRAGKSTCTGMPLSDHLTENEMTQRVNRVQRVQLNLCWTLLNLCWTCAEPKLNPSWTQAEPNLKKDWKQKNVPKIIWNLKLKSVRKKNQKQNKQKRIIILKRSQKVKK